MTQICVGKPKIIGSDNGLSPVRREAIIWTNAGILLIRPLGTHFSEILIDIRIFSFKKMFLKMSSAKWRPYCLGLKVLRRKDSLHIETGNRVVIPSSFQHARTHIQYTQEICTRFAVCCVLLLFGGVLFWPYTTRPLFTKRTDVLP